MSQNDSMNKMIYYIQMLTFTKYIYGNSNNKSKVIKIKRMIKALNYTCKTHHKSKYIYN